MRDEINSNKSWESKLVCIQDSEVNNFSSRLIQNFRRRQQENARISQKNERVNLSKPFAIQVIQRQIEKEKISEVRTAEEKLKKTEKFEEKFKLNKENMIETSQKCQ